MQPNDSESSAFDPTAQHAALGAAHWLATLTDENCTDAERQQFLEWLRASTRNVEEFLRLSTLARSASERELWPDENIEELVAAARASANVAPLRPAGVHQSVSGRRSFRWAIAASLACIVALGAAVLMSPTVTQLWQPDYRTEVGEQRSITLDDGSVVQLNSRSHLRTLYNSEARIADLIDGEAIFRVATDPQRPFRVRTGATEIVAVGTAFNVNAETQRTVVTVLEGRVRVNRRAAPDSAGSASDGLLQNMELTVGEQAIVAPAQPIVRIALSDTEKVTSWTQRRLIFEDTTLRAAAAQFARYSTRAIRIQDQAIAERRISGVFDATDPGSLVQFLRADATVAVREDESGWVIGRK